MAMGKENDIRGQILDRMRRLCSRREYCTGDIHRKAMDIVMKKVDMADDAYARETASGIVAVLVSEKFLDDRRYASAFVRDKSSLSGWGGMKIRRALAAKGLDRELIDEALADIDGAAARARMRRVLEVKLRSLEKTAVRQAPASSLDKTPGPDTARETYALKTKLLRFALSRGYGYEEALQEIEELLSGR